MVRIVNGNIVEDDDRSNLAAANGASGNVAPGGFLETMAQPVEIYGYQTNYQMLAGLGLAVVLFGGVKWGLLYGAVLYFLLRKSLAAQSNGAPPRPSRPAPNRSVDYATSGGTTSMNNDDNKAASNDGQSSGFISSFLGAAPSQSSRSSNPSSSSSSPFKKQGNITTFGH